MHDCICPSLIRQALDDVVEQGCIFLVLWLFCRRAVAMLQGKEPLFMVRLIQLRDGCILGITINHAITGRPAIRWQIWLIFYSVSQVGATS